MFREDRLRRREPWGLVTVSWLWTADPSWAWRQCPPATNLSKNIYMGPPATKTSSKIAYTKASYTKLGNFFFALTVANLDSTPTSLWIHPAKCLQIWTLISSQKHYCLLSRSWDFTRGLYIYTFVRGLLKLPQIFWYFAFLLLRRRKKSEKTRFSTYEQ